MVQARVVEVVVPEKRRDPSVHTDHEQHMDHVRIRLDLANKGSDSKEEVLVVEHKDRALVEVVEKELTAKGEGHCLYCQTEPTDWDLAAGHPAKSSSS